MEDIPKTPPQTAHQRGRRSISTSHVVKIPENVLAAAVAASKYNAALAANNKILDNIANSSISSVSAPTSPAPSSPALSRADTSAQVTAPTTTSGANPPPPHKPLKKAPSFTRSNSMTDLNAANNSASSTSPGNNDSTSSATNTETINSIINSINTINNNLKSSIHISNSEIRKPLSTKDGIVCPVCGKLTPILGGNLDSLQKDLALQIISIAARYLCAFFKLEN